MKKFLAILALASLALIASPADASGVADCSGSMTTGGTSQTAIPTGTPSFVYIENPSATVSGVSAESLFVNIGAAAATSITANHGSIELPNGATLKLSFNVDGPILWNSFAVNAATTGHKFICKVG